MSPSGTPERPLYRMVPQEGRATRMWMITVDEGWRSWILCTDMYSWAADQLLGILRKAGHQWMR